MRKLNTTLLAGLALTSLLYVSVAGADDERHRVKANLSGFQETPSTLSTPGSGRFTAKIDDDAQTIDYRLSYEGLEAPAIAAHIHLGARATSGGVSAFLCGGGNKPACPPAGGIVTGTITPADIIGPTAQGIAPGEFAEVVRAIRNGAVMVSTPGSLVKGKTASLTATPGSGRSSGMPSSSRVRPAITAAASLARGTPVALLTKGTVREARGFTSSTWTTPAWMAYWTLINPTTPSASANALVWRRISSTCRSPMR